MSIFYDRTGASYEIDHEVGDIAYVRPMVKVIVSAHYHEHVDETEDFEPAKYLVSMPRSHLFDAPPIKVVDEELLAKKAELEALKSSLTSEISKLKSERITAEDKLRTAKRQLDDWMKSHKIMTDLGRLLDGNILYPLSTHKNSYHHTREIPYIPEMRFMDILVVGGGMFGKDQPWHIKRGSDTYGRPFRFFDTEEERNAQVQTEFEQACTYFRKSPNFDTTSYTSSTTLHFGTLLKWVECFPHLTIPDDITAMKDAHIAELVEQRKAKLAAELEALGSRGEA